jgi:hypothetical protein
MRRDRRRIYQGLAHRLQDVDPRVLPTTADGISGLAIQGTFFLGFDPGDGSLVVRLPQQRISSLVDAGVGHKVETGGRVADDRVGIDDPVRWDGFAEEALAFVGHTAA